MPASTKPPTPTEYAVLAIVQAGLLIKFGLAGLGAGFLAAPEKQAIGATLQKLGAVSLGLGLLVAAACWAIRHWGPSTDAPCFLLK